MVKIIDDKGRLFGKINIIDLFAIIFLIALLPMFFFGYKIMKAKDPGIPKVINLTVEEYVEYEKAQDRYDASQIKYNILQTKISNLLSEHHRLRKYFLSEN